MRYRSWSDSSSTMELDIILEGFLQAESTHGVQFNKFIGDRDSSVHSTLITGAPGWGRATVRLECANHTSKYYRGRLELVQRKTLQREGRLDRKN